MIRDFLGRSAGSRPLAGWLLSLAALLALPTMALADNGAEKGADGFQSIFNGQNLEGWDGDPKFWRVEDGAITGQTTPENPTRMNTFCIWRAGDKIDDFVLRAKFKIKGGNSGIQYRSKDNGNWSVGGYQADFDAGLGWTGSLYEERGRGVLAKRGSRVVIKEDGKKETTEIAKEQDILDKIKKDDWNEYEISAIGNRLTQKLNGMTTIEVVDEQASARAMSGILALQVHAGEPMKVQFKDIEIKRLRLSDNRKKIVLVAGSPSHGPGDHEFNAGCLILQKCLNKLPNVVATEYKQGWPKDPTAFQNADSILFYMDGGGGHPLIRDAHLQEIGQLIDKGVGICCAHYAVEIPKDKGGPELTRWIGGFYETGYSINPHWTAEFKTLPKHPVTSGVKPFSIKDEWYYNIRFPESMSGLDIVLEATPPDDTRHTAAAKEHPGRSEVVAWTIQRPDGGRGFGFTGGHNHVNWGNDDFRKLVLNALVWTAKGDVPADGVPSEVKPEELKENLDPKGK